MNLENDIVPTESDDLLRDLKSLIDQGRQQAVASVNSALTMTYWQVGRRINDEILQGQRAEYGKQLVASLAKELVALYGKSFEARNLRRMMQFAEVFPDFEIVSPLVSQLSWPHFTVLMGLRKPEARTFYIHRPLTASGANASCSLPPKELLEEKLHNTLIEVRE